MNPAVLVADLRGRGFALTVAAGSLRVSPASTLTPADREAIRADLPARSHTSLTVNRGTKARRSG
jgi:hypothetical protein